MKTFFHKISLASMAASLITIAIAIPVPARAVLLRFEGTVVDTLGRPVSGANADVSFTGTLVGGRTFNFRVNDFLNTLAFKEVSGSRFTIEAILRGVTSISSVNAFISPTQNSSINFVPENFSKRVEFSPTTMSGEVAGSATFIVTPVPENSYVLATLAFGALGLSSRWKRKNKSD